jgi:hypothetical protein
MHWQANGKAYAFGQTHRIRHRRMHWQANGKAYAFACGECIGED